MNCQMFSTGLSSGDFGGRGNVLVQSRRKVKAARRLMRKHRYLIQLVIPAAASGSGEHLSVLRRLF